MTNVEYFLESFTNALFKALIAVPIIALPFFHEKQGQYCVFLRYDEIEQTFERECI